MDDELYRELIIGHYKSPQNFGALLEATHHKHEDNPMCGDELDLYVHYADGVLHDISFSGQGCAISIAAASLLTEEIKGATTDEVHNFDEQAMLELLEVPITYTRRKCALLCYTAVKNLDI